MSNIKYIIVHHTGGTDANPLADSSDYSVYQCNNDHKVRFNMRSSLGWYVGYTYFIDKNGIVTQTRKDGEEGAHTVGYNNKSIGVCLAGNFDATLPTKAQVDSLKKLLQEKSSLYSIPKDNIVPHRAFASKTCYGKKLPDDWARNLVQQQTSILPASLGDKGENITKIQEILHKNNCIILPVTSATYDEFMAKSVLYFQLKNNVADIKELASLRGERVGPKTINILNKLA